MSFPWLGGGEKQDSRNSNQRPRHGHSPQRPYNTRSNRISEERSMDYESSLPEQYRREQVQSQVFRSAQASKQMLYEVFGNVISILEEFERRELNSLQHIHDKSVQKSDIYIPDQSHKKDHDVQRIVETQLLLFQTHLHQACRPEIRDEVLDELKQATKKWLAVRKDRGFPVGKTDEYAAQLYEILSKGQTQHPSVFMERPQIDGGELTKAAQQYFEGDHRRAQVDEEFRRDPNKRAAFPAVRAGSSADTGIDRMEEYRADLVGDHRQSSLR